VIAREGVELIPVRSRAYPRALRKNLRPVHCPLLIYTRGNQRLLQESTACVFVPAGASEPALQFADAAGRKIAREGKVLVAGLMKGMDRTALEALLRCRGRGILVGAQGLKTMAGDLAEYHPQFMDGDVLVLSCLFPRQPWSNEQELVGASTVFGLSEDLYVAESDSEGFIWSGSIGALRGGRRIFVRRPGAGEENANDLLIARGAVPVDKEGEILPWEPSDSAAPLKQLHFSDVRDGFESKLRNCLIMLKHPATAREIKEYLKLGLSVARLSRMLEEMDFVRTSKGADGGLLFGLGKKE
jgi:predicted Rossmann fold nucleotide-binding protein DprA/Smf involved in DNA uptake